MKKTEREKLQLWLEVDVFGLHEEGLVVESDKCRPVHAEVPLKIDQRFIAEPGMPLWKPLREALQTEEEQDSDVYFVLRGSGEGGAAAGGGVELGTAHVNLEQLQKRGRDVAHERLSVIDTQERKVASLVVSVRALEALRWVARGADESCRLGVGVGLLELSAGGRERLGTASKQSVLVRVELPQGLPPLRTREVRLSEKRVDFGFYGDVEVAPGSAQQGALAAALASAAEEESSVEFVLLAAGVAGGERERELGHGSVALHTLLRDGFGALRDGADDEEEEAHLVLPLTAGAKQAPLGTLEVTLKALKALKALLASSVASVAALPPPTAAQLAHRALGKALTEPLLQDYSMEDSDDEGASSGVPWALLDGLEVPAHAADLLASPRDSGRTKGAARRAAKEQPAATPEHGAAELAAMLQAALYPPRSPLYLPYISSVSRPSPPCCRPRGSCRARGRQRRTGSPRSGRGIGSSSYGGCSVSSRSMAWSSASSRSSRSKAPSCSCCRHAPRAPQRHSGSSSGWLRPRRVPRAAGGRRTAAGGRRTAAGCSTSCCGGRRSGCMSGCCTPCTRRPTRCSTSSPCSRASASAASCSSRGGSPGTRCGCAASLRGTRTCSPAAHSSTPRPRGRGARRASASSR